MNELGWIKLHRKIINNPIMLNAELLQIFVYCLLRANYEDAEIIFNGKLESVKRGSFITGRKIMAEKLNQSESGLYKRLQLLDTLGYIKIKSNNKFSVITIVNYSTYQLPESPEEQQSNNKVTTKEQQSNTDKNIKEYKEGKEINISFEQFWSSYDKKVGSKPKLEKKWNNLTDSEREAVMLYIPKYKDSQPDKQFRKNPETFLNNKSWLDEIISKTPPRRNTVQEFEPIKTY